MAPVWVASLPATVGGGGSAGGREPLPAQAPTTATRPTRSQRRSHRNQLDTTVAIFEPDYVVELRGRHLDDVGVFERHQLPMENYGWYIDLRQYGTVPHSGFGLGLERTVAWLCGISHIRETSPYPRTINRMWPER